MAKEELEALLEKMESIAKAVNSFTSETVQQEAFSALIAAFEGKRHGEKEPPPIHKAGHLEPHEPSQLVSAGSKTKPDKAPKTKKASKGSISDWKMVKDLNLHPDGKPSFDEFMAEKQPPSNEDKYAVVVYYLSEILETPAVTISQVGTVFRLTKSWKEPKNVASGLRVASSRKGTIDTKNYEDIKITPAGRNFVEHDLPPKTKSSK